MKHVKLFTTFSGNSESVNEDARITAGEIRDLLDAGETSDEFKEILIKKGVTSDLLLRMARSLKWTKEEVLDLENKTERSYSDMETILSLHEDDKIKFNSEIITKIKKLLADRTRMMNAIKNL